MAGLVSTATNHIVGFPEEIRELMNKNVLVIGGSGFLGSHMADELSETGYNVTIFDRISSPWVRDDQSQIIGDILDAEAIKESVKEKRYVFHLAGIADIGESTLNPQKTIKTNIIGSTNVIEACLSENIDRLMFASTLYVYSRQGSFYRVSKQASEQILENYSEHFGLEYTILRYGSLYGPRAQNWNGLKNYILQAVKNGKVEYHGTGDEKREYINVKDAAKLSIQALNSEYANQCLTLTGTQSISSKELMIMIKEILGGKLEIKFNKTIIDRNHYSITPYRFTPKVAKKLVTTHFYDLGQGILDLVEEIYNENNK